MARLIIRRDGEPFVFVSDDPREERLVPVTDDLPLPALEPWDGVETCPGVLLERDDDDDSAVH